MSNKKQTINNKNKNKNNNNIKILKFEEDFNK
jgi:hypothetical protein